VSPHKDGDGFNILLLVFPLDGKIVCRAISEEDEAEEPTPSSRPKHNNTDRNAHAASRHGLQFCQSGFRTKAATIASVFLSFVSFSSAREEPVSERG